MRILIIMLGLALASCGTDNDYEDFELYCSDTHYGYEYCENENYICHKYAYKPMACWAKDEED